MKNYGLRVSAFFAALFLIYGFHIPYLPLWLEWRGLTAGEIGIVTAVPYFLRLVVTPSVAFAADRIGDQRRVILVLAWGALASALLLSQSAGFWTILATSSALAILTWTIMPLTETVAIAGVRRGLDYGRMRLWGSLTFIAASFIGGAIVDASGRGAGIWLVVAGIASTVGAAYLLPAPARLAAFPLPGPDGGAAGAASGEAERGARGRGIDRATVLRLASDPCFVLFLVGVGTVMASHATFYTFGAIQWRAGGLSSAWIGTLWAIGVIAEIALFAWSGAVLARLGALTLLLAGCVGAVLRWAAMSLDPPLAALVPLQVLHGLTYGAAHLGAIHFIGKAVPEEAGGTAQALYSTIAAGVMQGGATMLSGALYAHYGSGAYLAMSAMAAVGCIATLLLARRWNGGLLWRAA
jgi:PPP family 3-phenylpropionic acid transporter